ncbi:MAG: Elongation factor P--(R)-beta-lysine ligase [Candidatus Anoxychlamydiales bacterium]|nr:Elongation factor P--(R)-beta-lysine ligase [Candidatus Anoxychlamydiales bacterium]
MSPESLKILKDRSLMLKKVRSFLDAKKIIEVDTPILVKYPSIDENIESVKTHPNKKDIRYLHTSPEYLMKRLIAKNYKNIYFLGHVFRKNEIGDFHNIEFTMLEWYRSNTTFKRFIKENIDLIKLFVKFKKVEKISYFDLFYKNFKIDIFKCSKKDLIEKCKKYKIIISNIKSLKKSDFLNLLIDYFFNHLLKKNILYFVYDYPKEEAMLAKTYIKDGNEVAFRFEIFFNGFELANGYLELNDEKILRERFERIIKIKKKHLSKKNILDENFLKSINHIGDNLFGIAIGFDRLMMLRHKTHDIKDVLYFSYLEL